MDLLWCGILALRLAPSLAFIISMLSSSLISALVFQLKKSMVELFSITQQEDESVRVYI
jgi:hypothetical protein